MSRPIAAVFCSCLFASWSPAQQAVPPKPTPLTLDDLISDPDLRDASVSPSGKYIALTLWRKDSDMLVVMDLNTKTTKVLSNFGHDVAGKRLDVHMESVFWKNEERIVFRTSIYPDEHDYQQKFDEQTILKMGERLFAINRDGSKLVRLMGENAEGALDGALNFGSIASYLPNDPDHIVVFVRGFAGPSLFKVDVNDGTGIISEKPKQRIDGWWLDIQGHAALRLESVNGTIRIMRHESGDDWSQVLRYRPNQYDEHPDYELLDPSDQAGKFYVLARPDGKDRRGIYLYDVAREAFGEVLHEHPIYDLESARVSRDGKRVVSYCYYAHVYTCQFTDPKIEAHMRGVRKFFGDAANVNLLEASADDKTILFFVAGPHDAPAYYYYRVDQARIEPLGMRRDALNGRPLPTGSVVKWKARDGLELSGYLIRPPGAEKATRMPLVVMPHGGPEVRDHLDFDAWTQFLAAQGYAIFQPNFRGSDGFGKKFKESGWGEWGGKMQDDITDGLDALIAGGSVDPARVCIVGASYGGYAALAGVVKTPEKYRCAISVSGISDLDALVKWERGDWRRGLGWADDSEGYQHILKMIGDPGKDAARLDSTSPAQHAAAVKVPVLLIHGEDDIVTPISQSERMAKALDKAGQKAEFVRLPQVGHLEWRKKTERQVLSKMQEFLLTNLGRGIPYNP
jgi:dipeptidyl aminopeptidase/acylaminoacyl peptidase